MAKGGKQSKTLSYQGKEGLKEISNQKCTRNECTRNECTRNGTHNDSGQTG